MAHVVHPDSGVKKAILLYMLYHQALWRSRAFRRVGLVYLGRVSRPGFIEYIIDYIIKKVVY
jgi:hypothetical protein